MWPCSAIACSTHTQHDPYANDALYTLENMCHMVIMFYLFRMLLIIVMLYMLQMIHIAKLSHNPQPQFGG